MLAVLLKALSFVFIICLGYFLKRRGIFGPKDYSVVTKIVMNATLPATIITSIAGTELTGSVLLLPLCGFVINCLLLSLGLLIGRNRDRGTRALLSLALPGYNIGAFALPFAQGFLGAAGSSFAMFFDMGNAIMCTGGSYAVTDTVLAGSASSSSENGTAAGSGHKTASSGNSKSGMSEKLRELLKKLCSSVPFLTYSLMLILGLLKIHIPEGFTSFIQPIANANPFCGMFMIGLMFEPSLPRSIRRDVLRITLIRIGSGLILAFACFHLLPLPLIAKQAVCVAVFAPPSVLTPVFTERCGGSSSVASCAASLCTVTSLICMTCVILLLHIA